MLTQEVVAARMLFSTSRGANLAIANMGKLAIIFGASLCTIKISAYFPSHGIMGKGQRRSWLGPRGARS